MISEVAQSMNATRRRQAKMLKRLMYALLFCVTPIALGVLVYAVFRDTSVLKIPIPSIRIPFIETFQHSAVIQVIANSLPDGLWAFAFSSSMILLWRRDKWIIRGLTYLLSLVVMLSLEFLQKMKVISGTFDWIDILFISIFSISAWGIVILEKYNWRTTE